MQPMDTSTIDTPVPTWLLVVSGIAAVLFGLATLFWPSLTLVTLVFLFGAFALVTGVVQLVAMFRAIGGHETWWTHLILAVLNLAVALFVFLYPGMTTWILLWAIAFWSITIGIFEIARAFSTGQFLAFIAGVLGIVVGFILLANPAAGILAFIIVLGVFAIVRGVMLIIQAFQQPSTRATPSV
jgi:uncharacterized membrane protein HdeD (DUF308 family)